MSRKFITGVTLFLAIGFLVLGIIFKSAADKQQGVTASSGILLNGQYVETSSGRIGVNTEKYESLNRGGTIFYILTGVTGVICVVSSVTQRKSK